MTSLTGDEHDPKVLGEKRGESFGVARNKETKRWAFGKV